MQYTIRDQLTLAERQLRDRIAREFSIPPALAEILSKRNFSSMDEVRAYLHPQLSSLPDPDTMKGMKEAISLILHALLYQTPIFVHGDYDVDGITSTTLLVKFFREVGLQVSYYIPNRLEERYSLSESSLRHLLPAKPSGKKEKGLVVTVDCGISAHAEVDMLREQGYRVLITDHHEVPDTLPRADAIINPKQQDCPFRFKHLSGVGVAFFLAMSLRRALMKAGHWQQETAANLKNYLDLVALGTVADVMPLVGVNRILVRAGLEVLSEKQRPGILALCENATLTGGKVLSEDISFRLAPRLNAAGRLGQPMVAVELLLAWDFQEARSLAQQLEQFNIARKEIENQALEWVFVESERQCSQGAPALVIYVTDCHPGVIGIIASRVVDRYNRPTIIFTEAHDATEHKILKGSGRSVPGCNLYEMLKYCESSIEQYGGHAMAVGLTIDQSQLEAFSHLFRQGVAQLDDLDLATDVPLRVDYYSSEKNIFTPSFFQAIQVMQPFGEGNPEPMFLLKRERLFNKRDVKGHLLFTIQPNNGQRIRGIGFGLARDDYPDQVDLIVKMKQSYYRGVERQEIQVVKIG